MFSGAHLHLLVNHVPIMGALFALALFTSSIWYARGTLQRTALAVLVVVAIFSGIAKLSGDPAENATRGMPGVTRAATHEHEDMADKAFLLAAALGIGAVVCLARWRTAELPSGVIVGCVAGNILVAIAMAYTGLLGGQIRHTEVRPGATAADALAVEPPRAPRAGSQLPDSSPPLKPR